ncbi:hypothetical protein TNIN_297371 [Trichonephila inaurata madagascariensis]|uniref:Uncharacterized protein n=1 Tax=Trichonephila inaurata madagascariensis TaxID=2747483 RepID=A0A8X6X5Z4_9ARAC|nr:hypothetical protein TNIN_297371 [Trichonephila inaurata madagascariensis]
MLRSEKGCQLPEHTPYKHGNNDSSDCSICLSSDDSERDKISIGCDPSEFTLHVLRDILNGEPLLMPNLEEIMSDTESESDLYLDSDSDSESVSESESENESIPVLEFIPNTLDQFIEDMLESVTRQ